MLRLVLLFLTCAWALLAHTCTEQNVVDCLRTYMDTNNDGGITAAEWNNFTLYHDCSWIIPRIAGSAVLAECDADNDGVLNATDVSHRNSCLSWAMQEDICMYCQQCADQMT